MVLRLVGYVAGTAAGNYAGEHRADREHQQRDPGAALVSSCQCQSKCDGKRRQSANRTLVALATQFGLALAAGHKRKRPGRAADAPLSGAVLAGIVACGGARNVTNSLSTMSNSTWHLHSHLDGNRQRRNWNCPIACRFTLSVRSLWQRRRAV